MTDRLAYQYVVLRCVPRVEREEFVNVGVVLYCQMADFLQAGWHVSPERLRALADIPVDAVCDALRFVDAVCRGDASVGAVATEDLGARFGFIKSPRSTVVQPGPVHGGTSTDCAAELDRLLDALVR